MGLFGIKNLNGNVSIFFSKALHLKFRKCPIPTEALQSRTATSLHTPSQQHYLTHHLIIFTKRLITKISLTLIVTSSIPQKGHFATI